MGSKPAIDTPLDTPKASCHHFAGSGPIMQSVLRAPATTTTTTTTSIVAVEGTRSGNYIS